MTKMQIIIDNTNMNADLEHMAQEFCRMKEQVARMTKEVDAYKETLLSAAKERGAFDKKTHKLIVGEYEISCTEASMENFSLKKAREVISPEILAPFISISNFDKLKVKRLAGDGDE